MGLSQNKEPAPFAASFPFSTNPDETTVPGLGSVGQLLDLFTLLQALLLLRRCFLRARMGCSDMICPKNIKRNIGTQSTSLWMVHNNYSILRVLGQRGWCLCTVPADLRDSVKWGWNRYLDIPGFQLQPSRTETQIRGRLPMPGIGSANWERGGVGKPPGPSTFLLPHV